MIISAEKEHEKLVSFMLKHATRFPKKHGNWLKFSLGARFFIVMDSWNKNIKIVEGDCVYNYWVGFEGCKLIEYIGGNFGGFNKGADDAAIKEWHRKALAKIGVNKL